MLELTSSSSSVGSRGAAVDGGCGWGAGYVPVRAVGVVAPCTAYLGPGRNSAYWTLCTYQLNDDDDVLPPPPSSTTVTATTMMMNTSTTTSDEKIPVILLLDS